MNRKQTVFGFSLLAATCGLAFATRPVHAQVLEDAPAMALSPVVVGPSIPAASLLANANLAGSRLAGQNFAANQLAGYTLSRAAIQGPNFIGPGNLLANASGTWWNEAGQAAGNGAVEGAVSGAVAGAFACGPAGAAEGAGVGALAGAAAGFATYALSSGVPGTGPIAVNPMARLD